ncbi:MAG: hypothetical protein GWN01_15680 [Nitrosopumilaceae archaeon]|nr:hypothetical protein [Nitrosopumilaceae archaeon]NIX62883.1 hypothetical protein [Nitrosopumilaceae archaeon]
MYPYYPYTVYVQNNPEVWDEYRPVIINGYTEAISFSAFKNLMLKTGSDLGYGKYQSLDVYKCLYSCEYRLSDLRVETLCHKIVGESINLYDFYKEIGFDKKTKKLNGLTMYQHVKKFMKSLDEKKEDS